MLNKTKWLVKEAKLRIKYMVNKDCIFCKIARGEIATKLVLETESVIAFSDINPVASVHILIVPRRHIESVVTIKSEDASWIIDMFSVAKKIAKDMSLDAFRLAFNGGRYQHVLHLHMHLLAGGSVEWSKL